MAALLSYNFCRNLYASGKSMMIKIIDFGVSAICRARAAAKSLISACALLYVWFTRRFSHFDGQNHRFQSYQGLTASVINFCYPKSVFLDGLCLSFQFKFKEVRRIIDFRFAQNTLSSRRFEESLIFDSHRSLFQSQAQKSIFDGLEN